MSSVFGNPKVFFAASMLFAVATLANLSRGNSLPVNPVLSTPYDLDSDKLKASPTMPPDPWTEPPVQL
jgi:hypothetical protein